MATLFDCIVAIRRARNRSAPLSSPYDPPALQAYAFYPHGFYAMFGSPPGGSLVQGRRESYYPVGQPAYIPEGKWWPGNVW